MASPTQWTWIWVDSGGWWWTGRPDVLWFMGSQRVRHDWVTELNWKSRDIILLTKVHIVKGMVFSLVMYGFESWTIRKAECQRIDAFKLWCWRTLQSPLESKEIKPIYPKRNESWMFIGRTEAEAEAEAPILWPPDAKNWLVGKDPNAGKDCW